MADKQKTRKEPLQNIPIQNSLLINLVRSFQSTLTLFGLYNDFKAQKSLKIFIRILRQRNTEMGMILYTDTEERIFQQKSHFRRMQKEVTTSQPQYRHFQESLIEQTNWLHKTNQIQEKVCNTQQLKNENLQVADESPIENIISLKRERLREQVRKTRMEETFKEKRKMDQTKISLFMNNKKEKMTYQQFRKEQYSSIAQKLEGRSLNEISRAVMELYEDYLKS